MCVCGRGHHGPACVGCAALGFVLRVTRVAEEIRSSEKR
jgi:hypothetical protein